MCVFSFSFFSRNSYFPFNFFLIHLLLFNRVLFNFHASVNFLVPLLLLISNFVLLRSAKIYIMMSIFLNLLRLVLWHNIWSILENVPCSLEKSVYSTVDRKNVNFYGWLTEKAEREIGLQDDELGNQNARKREAKGSNSYQALLSQMLHTCSHHNLLL